LDIPQINGVVFDQCHGNDLDLTLELLTEIAEPKEECACQSTKMQTNKSRTPRVLAYVK